MHVYRDLHCHAVVNSYRQCADFARLTGPILQLCFFVVPKLHSVMTIGVASKERFLLRSGIDYIVSAYEGAGRRPALFRQYGIAQTTAVWLLQTGKSSSVLVPRTTSKLLFAFNPKLV
jgi:tRNA(Leu) C34 or U34 (ribose-2'-O)-methylase TrmL